jgi:hypothetical protein
MQHLGEQALRTRLGWAWLAGLLAAVAVISPAAAQAEQDLLANLWLWRSPQPTTLLLIVLVLVLSIAIGFALYRAMLRQQVRNGIHPHVFGATLGFLVGAINLWFVFTMLFADESVGLGIPAVLFGIFLFVVVIMLALGKIRGWLMIVLVILAALIAFQILTA